MTWHNGVTPCNFPIRLRNRPALEHAERGSIQREEGEADKGEKRFTAR